MDPMSIKANLFEMLSYLSYIGFSLSLTVSTLKQKEGIESRGFFNYFGAISLCSEGSEIFR